MEDDLGNDIIVTNYWTFQGAGGYTPFYDSIFHRYTQNNGDGPHYFFNKKNTIYAKMLICQDMVELNQKQIYIM